MRVILLSGGTFDLHGPAGEKSEVPVRLYMEAGTGRVYALSDEVRDTVDPLWRAEGEEG